MAKPNDNDNEHDDDEIDHNDDHAAHCKCAEHNANEMHTLVTVLGKAAGVDLCDHERILDLDDDGEDLDADLQLIHDLSIAQGASCSGRDDDDDEDEDDDDEDEDEDDEDDEDEKDAEFGDIIEMDEDDVDVAGVATFRKWTKEERDALDPEDFAGPGHTFPIADQDDVESAARLIGKSSNPDAVKARIIKIAKRKGLTIPDAWQADKSAAMSAMSAMSGAFGSDTGDVRDLALFNLGTPKAEGEWVKYENSLLFKSGDYASHNYSMTPEELWAAAEAFSEPVPNELEHVNSGGTATILDGKLGHVESVRLADGPDGHELRGTVKIPRWLDEAWDVPHKQISAVWDRGSKTLQRLGLVVKGRVQGAALMAAFSAQFAKDGTWSGTRVLQDIHDKASEAGAICKDDGRSGAMMADARFHSTPEMKAIQAAHDEACKGGAKCRMFDKAEMDRRGVMMSDLASFTERKRHEHADKTHQAIHDVIGLAYPACCSGGSMMPPAAPGGMAGGSSSAGGGAPSGGGAPAAMADTPEQLKAIKSIHNSTVEHGASCPGKAKMSARLAGSTLARFRMNKYAQFFEAIGDLPDEPTDTDMLALFRAAPRDAIETVAREAPADPLAAFADNPHFKALKDRADRLEAKAIQQEQRDLINDAVAFSEPIADRLVLNPRAALLLKLAYFKASEIDRKADKPVVTFTEGTVERSIGLAAALREVFASIHDSPDSHQIVDANGELPAEFSVLRNGSVGKSEAESEESLNKSLGFTETGRAWLESNGKH